MGSSRHAASDRARGFAAEQVARLRALGPLAAAGDDDAVHDARTATRRLRACLDLCGSLVGDTAPLADDLRDLGRALGMARDPAVELAWLRTAVTALPDGDPPARARLLEDRLEARRTALVALRGRLRGPTHADLLAALEAATARPWSPDGGCIARRAAREWHRLDRRAAAAERAGDDDHDTALHAMRRQARRARYAAELVGRPATRSAALAEGVQDALGAQHDAVLVRAVLLEVEAQARAAGEDTTTYERLVAVARAAADDAERAAARAAARLRDPHHRDWMP